MDNIIQENDFIIVYETIQSIKQLQVIKGKIFQNKFGQFSHDDIIGKEYGSKILSKKKDGSIHVLQPDPILITETLQHKTQILYDTDISLVICKLNIKPGSVIVESGTGSCSLSCSILNTIKNEGHLHTFEFNEERYKNAIQVFKNLKFENVKVTHRDVLGNGFLTEHLQQNRADAVFLDLPKPYDAICHAKQVLKSNGRICCFSPCIEQVQKNCQKLQDLGFVNINTIECLQRFFENKHVNLSSAFSKITKKKVQALSSGAKDNKGHTAYLTFAILP